MHSRLPTEPRCRHCSWPRGEPRAIRCVLAEHDGDDHGGIRVSGEEYRWSDAPHPMEIAR